MYSSEKEFSTQTPMTFQFFGYDLIIPNRHHLLLFFDSDSSSYQPYRERGLILCAQVLKQIARKGTIIDIGANIGDSLAILARYCDLPVLCVEGSDFFYAYLEQNIATHFAQQAKALHGMVLTDKSTAPKGLMHWGGTAKTTMDVPFTEKSQPIAMQQLLHMADQISLLKLDTDGADIALLEAMFASDKKIDFPVYFELEFTHHEKHERAISVNEAIVLFNKLPGLGYETAFVWDDPGRFYGQLDLMDSTQIHNMINYMTQVEHRPVWGVDLCLVHKDDKDFTTTMQQAVSKEMMIGL